MPSKSSGNQRFLQAWLRRCPPLDEIPVKSLFPPLPSAPLPSSCHLRFTESSVHKKAPGLSHLGEDKMIMTWFCLLTAHRAVRDRENSYKGLWRSHRSRRTSGCSLSHGPDPEGLLIAEQSSMCRHLEPGRGGTLGDHPLAG